jgi:cobyric acid synthase
VGIVPFLPRIGLPEEDSVVLEGRQRPSHEIRSDCLSIGVVRLPHISNFTDFDSLAGEHDVSLRFLENPHELEGIQVLILPGSKNVMADAVYLHQHGWDVAVHAVTGRGVEIVGICGGYQLLGQKISDPHDLESSARSVAGLGLLSGYTTLEVDKTLRRAVARYLPTDHTVHGYEIHHGRTFGNADVPVLERDDGTVIGNSDRSGLIWGTYLHGLFDDDGFRRHFVNRARLRVGLAPIEAGVSYDIEPAIQRFADAVRASVDVDFVLRDLGIR